MCPGPLASNGVRRIARILPLVGIMLSLAATRSVAAVSAASEDGLWVPIDAALALKTDGGRFASPEAVHTVQLVGSTLETILADVPEEISTPVRDGRLITLPTPDGFQRFRIVESPLLSPELQAARGDVRTYLGQGVDDPTAMVRADRTALGFRAMILSSGKTVFVDPIRQGDTERYVSYTRGALAKDRLGFECGVVEEGEPSLGLGKALPVSGTQLYTYRLAVTTTGEYTQALGGVVAAEAQMITTFNRVSGILEREFSARFSLVDYLIHDDPATDPYIGEFVSALLSTHQSQVDGRLGSSNYDIGHILSFNAGGGIAYRAGSCRSGSKARGASSWGIVTGDTFDVNVVAHEVGHQLGALHTFNGTTGSCSGNRTADAAYEPGSGSTIMSYAGICGGENVQPDSDDYFHNVSLGEMLAHRAVFLCGSPVPTGNTPPTVDAGPDLVLPIGTPFVLRGTTSDPDGDVVTHVWEQYDLGAPSPPGDEESPWFRSLRTGADPDRYLPTQAHVQAGNNFAFDVPVSEQRAMTFRLTARDNRAGGGAVADDEMSIAFVGLPFTVTNPDVGGVFDTDEPIDITWDVGGGTAATEVDIFLSTDGGSTYELIIGNTPNDGTEPYRLSCMPTTGGRVKIEAVGQAFYDVGRLDFTIQDARPDYVPVQQTGWDDILVPLESPGVFTSIPLPTNLAGDATFYAGYVYQNLGLGVGSGGSGPLLELRLDGMPIFTRVETFLNVGGFGVVFNQPLTAPGGRHTFGVALDALEEVCEQDEINNLYARQYIWTPVLLTAETSVVRSAPPDPQGGFGSIPGGGIQEDNVDGLRLVEDTGMGFWDAVSIHGVDPLDDYDLILFSSATDVFNGFDAASTVATSALPTLDSIFVNRRTTPGNFDIGIRNPSGGTGDYVAEHRVSTGAGFSVAKTENVQLASGQMVLLRELSVVSDQSVVVALDVTGATQPATLALFDWDFTTGTIADALATDATDGSGSASVTQAVEAGRHYGIAVLREPADGATPLDISLDVQSEATGVGDTPAQLAVNLRSVPNPFNPATEIQFAIARPGKVQVRIYDVVGRLIRELGGELEAGPHSLSWNGRDSESKAVGSGVYYYQLLLDGRKIAPTEKMSLLK